ncbi:aldo/keto reductase [Pseudomonas aeruginosa]|nr:aldo/keto reductase [Pseudomonas aeruginosa]
MSVESIRIEGIDTPVSRIGLGTWAIGGWMWGGADDATSVETIRRAVESGITLIDTAPVYGFGHSEEVVGKALQGLRDKAVIATKAALEWSDAGIHRNASAARIRREVEDSLRRLKTDRIDLYQIHWPDPLVAHEETAGELERLRRDGKILAIGVSNYSPEQMDGFRQFAPLASVQPPYNLFERAIDADVLPYAERNGIVVLAYGALCRGLLSGRMNAETRFDGDDLRKSDPKFQQPRFAQYLAAVAQLEELARERMASRCWPWPSAGFSIAALRWRAVGARKPEQLNGIADAFGWRLDDEAMARIERILAETIQDPVGPEFMAPPSRNA